MRTVVFLSFLYILICDLRNRFVAFILKTLKKGEKTKIIRSMYLNFFKKVEIHHNFFSESTGGRTFANGSSVIL